MTYANYHVGLKILLQRNDEVLFLRWATSECFDLPGGRIDDSEDNTPLLDILHREIREELGPDIQYQVGTPLFQYRRFRPELGFRIFLTVYDGLYRTGDIQISDEHSAYQWVNPNKQQLTYHDFLHKEEFEAFKNYFGW